MSGWIKLWRSSFDNPLYFAEPFTKWQAWVDLLLLANHKKNVTAVRGILVEVDRGQVLACEDFLAERWKWSRGKVRRFQSYLSSKTVQQIVLQKNNVRSIITVLNYDMYQDIVQQTVQQTDSRKPAESQQTDILKKDKNEENEKKERERARDQIKNPDVWNVIDCRPEFSRLRPETVAKILHDHESDPAYKTALADFITDASNAIECPKNPTGMLRGYFRSACTKNASSKSERRVSPL